MGRKHRKDSKREIEYAVKLFHKQKRINPLADPGVHDFVLVLDHLNARFNVGKIFRSADAFGARAVHLVGIDFFNPIPAKGSFKYVPARFHDAFESCYESLAKEGYSFYALEADGVQSITDAAFPKKSAFVFGHEEFGLSFQKEDFPKITGLKIPQFGKVESLNVSVAASVVMYEYVRQNPLSK